MPTSPSAKKRMRQTVKRRARNRTVKATLRTQVRKFREVLDAGDAEPITAELRLTLKKLDQAAAKGVIHKRTSARLKSRLNASAKKVVAPNKTA